MIEIDPEGKAKHVCIVLHGLGADGSDLAPLAPSIWPRPDVRWIFPDAPVRPISINGGMPMRGWFDVANLDRMAEQDEQGIRESATIIDEIIENEVARGFARKQIVLIGFSQGGAMALFAGLRQPSPLQAIVGLSSLLPLPETLDKEAGKDSGQVPIFLGAGELDDIIRANSSTEAAKSLSKRGNEVELRTYPSLGHAISPEEVSHVADFLSRHTAT